jgi:hypothetical protein
MLAVEPLEGRPGAPNPPCGRHQAVALFPTSAPFCDAGGPVIPPEIIGEGAVPLASLIGRHKWTLLLQPRICGGAPTQIGAIRVCLMETTGGVCYFEPRFLILPAPVVGAALLSGDGLLCGPP